MSSQARFQALFEEPACETNRAKDPATRKKGCSKPLTPGAAAGGCAFDGAKIVLQPVTDVAHLVHGPLACEGNSWDNRGAASSGSALWRRSFTTDLSELDVVMGQGEKKLFRAIREIVEAHAPPAVFVYETCVTALIGDDLDAVCFRAAERFGVPVVPVHAPGFAGSKNFGNKLAGEALLDHVIGAHEPDDSGRPTSTFSANTIFPANSGWSSRCSSALGIRVHTCIHRRRALSRHRRRAHGARQHDRVLDRARRHGAQDGGALGHSLFRGLVLRRLRHLRGAAQLARLLVSRRAPIAR